MHAMASGVIKLIREIEEVIKNDPQKTLGYLTSGDNRRFYMLQNLSDVLTTYLRREVEHALRQLNKTFGEDLANAICYPSVLTPEEIGKIIILYGNFFSWDTNDRLDKLLNHLPGESKFHPSESLNWTENVRLRFEKIPNASIAKFNHSSINRIRSINASSGWNDRTVAQTVGAFGYAVATDGIEFYFEDQDAAVLAVLTYA